MQNITPCIHLHNPKKHTFAPWQKIPNLLWKNHWIMRSYYHCQNPLLGNVLRSISPCIHERTHKEIQIKFKMGEETPPRRINSNGQNKSCPKNSCLNSKKSYIECDHKKSGLEFFPYWKIFGKIKQWLENNQISLFELRFKSFEF